MIVKKDNGAFNLNPWVGLSLSTLHGGEDVNDDGVRREYNEYKVGWLCKLDPGLKAPSFGLKAPSFGLKAPSVQSLMLKRM